MHQLITSFSKHDNCSWNVFYFESNTEIFFVKFMENLLTLFGFIFLKCLRKSYRFLRKMKLPRNIFMKNLCILTDFFCSIVVLSAPFPYFIQWKPTGISSEILWNAMSWKLKYRDISCLRVCSLMESVILKSCITGYVAKFSALFCKLQKQL